MTTTTVRSIRTHLDVRLCVCSIWRQSSGSNVEVELDQYPVTTRHNKKTTPYLENQHVRFVLQSITFYHSYYYYYYYYDYYDYYYEYYEYY